MPFFVSLFWLRVFVGFAANAFVCFAVSDVLCGVAWLVRLCVCCVCVTVCGFISVCFVCVVFVFVGVCCLNCV